MKKRWLKTIIITSYILSASLSFSQKGFSTEFDKNQAKFYNYLNRSRLDSALICHKLCEAIAKEGSDSVHIYSLKLQKANYLKLADNMQNIIQEVSPAYYFFKRKGDVYNELEAVYVIASNFYLRSQYDTTIALCKKYIPIATSVKDEKSVAFFYFLQGKCYTVQGKLDEAADVLRQALRFSKQTKNNVNIVQSLLGLASIYIDINANYAIAQLNETRAYLDKVYPNQKGSVYTAFGNAYSNIKMYDSAIYYYNKNLAIIDLEDDKTHYGAMVGNIGNVYLSMGKYDEALAKQFESLEYFMQSNDSMDIEIAYGTIADIYLKKKNYKEALNYYLKATNMSERLGFVEELIYNYTGLYQCYEQMGNYKEAYRTYKLYHKYNDSLRNVETAKKLTEQELNYRFENQQKEQQLVQKAKDDLTTEQIKRQKLSTYVALGGGAVLMIFLIVSVRNSNIRKRINKQLELSHHEINKQKNVIEHKNREITDSIMYASRIQQGILPDAEEIKLLLPNSFLFYRPRDIVSGDFYWMKQLKGSDKVGFEDLVGVVVADCTGHGVPGAFMSFIGSTILNQTLNNKKVDSPATALNYLNEQLPLTLKSKIKSGQINDGMEAGICVINKTKNKLYFAGANLNLIHIRNGIVNEIKGDKHSIGLNIEQQKTFTDNEIALEKGDCIYMFSDGYPDQFGGEKGKKYKYKNLLIFLKENGHLSADEQLQNLADNFDGWKKSLEQLDDVLLFGLKV